MKKVFWRKYHRLVSLIIAIPFSLTLITGLFLQLRQKIDFIQPYPRSTQLFKGKNFLSFEGIIRKAQVPSHTIKQIIFKPQKNQLSLRLKSGEEIQMHPQTGEIIHKQQRWTSFLINIHQGSFLGNFGQYFIFLLSSLGVLFLLISGLILFPRKLKKRSS